MFKGVSFFVKLFYVFQTSIVQFSVYSEIKLTQYTNDKF